MTLQLSPIVKGPTGAHTLLFLQGWPDDASVWDEQVAALSARYRCMRVTLPNYRGTKEVRWGYSTGEVVDALAGVLREAASHGPVTLVLHDWGAYWGYLLHGREPARVARVVGLDVAPHIANSPRGLAGIVAYQGLLLTAFLLGGSVGDAMTRWMAARAHAPGDPHTIQAWMNFPYRNFWLDLLTGSVRSRNRDYWPHLPLLFVYGKHKPFQFHSRAWIDHVQASGGEVLALACDHWVQRDPSFTRRLQHWLAETDSRLAVAT